MRKGRSLGYSTHASRVSERFSSRSPAGHRKYLKSPPIVHRDLRSTRHYRSAALDEGLGFRHDICSSCTRPSLLAFAFALQNVLTAKRSCALKRIGCLSRVKSCCLLSRKLARATRPSCSWQASDFRTLASSPRRLRLPRHKRLLFSLPPGTTSQQHPLIAAAAMRISLPIV